MDVYVKWMLVASWICNSYQMDMRVRLCSSAPDGLLRACGANVTCYENKVVHVRNVYRNEQKTCNDNSGCGGPCCHGSVTEDLFMTNIIKTKCNNKTSCSPRDIQEYVGDFHIMEIWFTCERHLKDEKHEYTVRMCNVARDGRLTVCNATLTCADDRAIYVTRVNTKEQACYINQSCTRYCCHGNLLGNDVLRRKIGQMCDSKRSCSPNDVLKNGDGIIEIWYMCKEIAPSSTQKYDHGRSNITVFSLIAQTSSLTRSTTVSDKDASVVVNSTPSQETVTDKDEQQGSAFPIVYIVVPSVSVVVVIIVIVVIFLIRSKRRDRDGSLGNSDHVYKNQSYDEAKIEKERSSNKYIYAMPIKNNDNAALCSKGECKAKSNTETSRLQNNVSASQTKNKPSNDLYREPLTTIYDDVPDEKTTARDNIPDPSRTSSTCIYDEVPDDDNGADDYAMSRLPRDSSIGVYDDVPEEDFGTEDTYNHIDHNKINRKKADTSANSQCHSDEINGEQNEDEYDTIGQKVNSGTEKATEEMYDHVTHKVSDKEVDDDENAGHAYFVLERKL